MYKLLLRRQEGFELTCREEGVYGTVGTLCFSNARTINGASGLLHPGYWKQIQTYPVFPALSPHYPLYIN